MLFRPDILLPSCLNEIRLFEWCRFLIRHCNMWFCKTSVFPSFYCGSMGIGRCEFMFARWSMMGIWILTKLSSSSRVSAPAWWHYFYSTKTFRGKEKWKFHKGFNKKVASYKTVAERPLTSHLPNLLIVDTFITTKPTDKKKSIKHPSWQMSILKTKKVQID